ncbi:hypothetical protein BGZ99_006660 [Dissophora globulifera]|uniref:Uncharacterized protein n=1 Tax=Dissophora globulifera TaxID=979702 RepID=A0A9P6RDT3_9FUNG|nr:hypothetical protein BGZ99_006660 [Dissophora globulifera]
MEGGNSTGQLWQRFQAHTSAKTPPIADPIDIVAYFNNKKGQHIVFLRDIIRVRVFKDADIIDNNGKSVPFLVDDDLEIILPERISYRPGVVLKVIVLPEQYDHARGGSIADLTKSSLSPSIDTLPDWTFSAAVHAQTASELTGIFITEAPGESGPKDDYDKDESSRMLSTASDNLAPAQDRPMEVSLAVSPRFLEPEKQPRRHSFSGPHETYFQAILSGQTQVASLVVDHFGRLQDTTDKILVLQHQLLRLEEEKGLLEKQLREEQLLAHERQDLMLEELKENQNQLLVNQLLLLENQQKAMDRLAIIQNRVQTVITQTYELHEYPIPRLFIILPKERRMRDKIKPFKQKYRLYFLCECGTHTNIEGSKISHEIHPAKHEGYDIDKPTEFFKKYGPYVITMLQMVRYGIIAAGIAVPVLAHLRLIEGIDAIQQGIDISKQALASLVDESISFVQDEAGKMMNGLNIPLDNTKLDSAELDRQEVLEGVVLRQLESYLKGQDESRVLGNLYRIVTTEGHVKWVCMDHYNDIYEQSAIKELEDIVMANQGTFVEKTGSVIVSFTSSIQAFQFFDAMVKARCIQELDVGLGWRVLQKDLQALTRAVTKANVVSLQLRLCGSNRQDNSGIIDKSLFQPLLHLMSNGRIQVMKFANIQLYDLLYVDLSEMKNAPKLRELCFKELKNPPNGGPSSLPATLDYYRSLAKLTVVDNIAPDVFDIVGRDLSLFPCLITLELHRTYEDDWNSRQCEYKMALHLAKGRIESVKGASFSVSYWEREVFQRFLVGGHITELSIIFHGAKTDMNRYMAILRHNPRLSKIALQTGEKYAEYIDCTIAIRKDVLDRGLPAEPLRFTGVDLDNHYVSYSLEFEPNSLRFGISSNITPGDSTREDVLEFSRKYGWSVSAMKMSSSINNKVAQAIGRSIQEHQESKLERLSLSLPGISWDERGYMDRLIRQSPLLSNLLVFITLSSNEWQEVVELLNGQVGKAVTQLSVKGSHDSPFWTPELAGALPLRNNLPLLRDLEIADVAPGLYVDSFALWIADMVSYPSPSVLSQQPPTRASNSSSRAHQTRPTSDTNSWAHLKRIKFLYLRLHDEQWKTVFTAIDLTAVEELHFFYCSISTAVFKIFVDRVLSLYGPDTVLPLRQLRIINGNLEAGDKSTHIERLKERAPEVEVKERVK